MPDDRAAYVRALIAHRAPELGPDDLALLTQHATTSVEPDLPEEIGEQILDQLTRGLTSSLSSRGSPGEARRCRVTDPRRIERMMKISAVLSMRLQGHSLDAIGAAQEPPVTKQAIWKLLKRAMPDMLVEPFEALRTIELARLDELTTGLYERAIGGDVQAVGAVLAVMMRRSRLLGLDQPVRFGAGANEFDPPLVKIEIVGGEAMAQAEQTARARLGLGPHLG
jgi:hypothetical protein